MTKMINRITGTEMWVADDRVPEYQALGHRCTMPTLDTLMENDKKAREARVETAKKALEKAPVKATAKRTTKKKA